MTQAIIPGCEENPDPKDVIIIDHTKPMKEIDMNETKNNVDNNDAFKHFLATGSSVIEACRELLAENERLRKMVEQRNEIMNVLTRHFNDAELGDICSSLDGKLTLLGCIEEAMDNHGIENADALNARLDKRGDEPADYQTLKDFKGEMDAIHEEFDIPHDVDAFRKDLKMGKDIADMIEANTDVDFSVDTWAKDLQDILDDYNTYKDACEGHCVEPHDLDSALEEKDQLDNVLSDRDITDASELEDTLTDMEDAMAYEKGFNELSEFVEKIKEVIGRCGDDIPSTDVEDYD